MKKIPTTSRPDRALAYLNRVLDTSSDVTSHETPARRTLFTDIGTSIDFVERIRRPHWKA